MHLTVLRKIFTSESTIGEMLIDGEFECVTLEDPIRENKIPGVTAIPAGSYDVVLGHSPKFGRKMPRLQKVPNFTGVLIHWGNVAKDTEGCILVGSSSSKNFIGSSKTAFEKLYAKLEKSIAEKQNITITIK